MTYRSDLLRQRIQRLLGQGRTAQEIDAALRPTLLPFQQRVFTNLLNEEVSLWQGGGTPTLAPGQAKQSAGAGDFPEFGAEDKEKQRAKIVEFLYEMEFKGYLTSDAREVILQEWESGNQDPELKSLVSAALGGSNAQKVYLKKYETLQNQAVAEKELEDIGKQNAQLNEMVRGLDIANQAEKQRILDLEGKAQLSNQAEQTFRAQEQNKRNRLLEAGPRAKYGPNGEIIPDMNRFMDQGQAEFQKVIEQFSPNMGNYYARQERNILDPIQAARSAWWDALHARPSPLTTSWDYATYNPTDNSYSPGVVPGQEGLSPNAGSAAEDALLSPADPLKSYLQRYDFLQPYLKQSPRQRGLYTGMSSPVATWR